PELTEDATVVRELIAAEYEQRRRREPDLTPGEFLDRFPAHAGALRHRLPPSPDRVASNGDSAPTQLASPSRPAQAWPRVPGSEILGVLGHGGMGVVYRARQVKLQRLVALKMLRAAEHAGPLERARLRAEAEAVARLQHPNIVQIHEIGEHDGLPFL